VPPRFGLWCNAKRRLRRNKKHGQLLFAIIAYLTRLTFIAYHANIICSRRILENKYVFTPYQFFQTTHSQL